MHNIEYQLNDYRIILMQKLILNAQLSCKA